MTEIRGNWWNLEHIRNFLEKCPEIPDIPRMDDQKSNELLANYLQPNFPEPSWNFSTSGDISFAQKSEAPKPRKTA